MAKWLRCHREFALNAAQYILHERVAEHTNFILFCGERFVSVHGITQGIPSNVVNLRCKSWDYYCAPTI